MNILSYNVRGLGDGAKQRRIRILINSGKFDLCMLQETKRVDIDIRLIWKLWGNEEVQYAVKESTGLSGGLICLWKKNSLNLISQFDGDGFIGLSCLIEGVVFHFVNIYSPCSLEGKRQLWIRILYLKSTLAQGEWCIGGDFNAVTSSSERIGVSGLSFHQESSEFNHFIEEMDLIDLPVTGKNLLGSAHQVKPQAD